MGKIEKKRPLGRPRCRWGVNISVYLKKKGWDRVNWIDLAEIRGQMGSFRFFNGEN